MTVAIVLLFLTFTGASIAKDVNIAAGIFLGIIEEDGTGPYQLILKEAAKRADVKFSEQVYPLKRAVKMFTNKKVLAIYGMTDAVIEEVGVDNIITSYPLGAYKVFIFTPKDRPVISSFEQLQGKRVGGINGYQPYYQSLVENKVDIHYFTHEDQQLERLKLGRIDAIIGFIPDWTPYLDKLHFDAQLPIHVGYDYMSVWNTPAGQAFVNKISPALLSMKLDGTLQKILAERYIDFKYKPAQKFEWLPIVSRF